MSDAVTGSATRPMSGLFATASSSVPGGMETVEVVDAEIVDDEPPTVPPGGGSADQAHTPGAGEWLYWWETQQTYYVPPQPTAPPTAGWPTAGAPYVAVPPPYVAPQSRWSGAASPCPPPPCNPCRPGSLPYCGGCTANPAGPVPVELVAPQQPVPVMLVGPPAEPEPFWDFSWLQRGASAAGVAAVPAWLLHRYLPPFLTGNYGFDAAVAIAIVWGGRPALGSLACGAAAYYGCHWAHIPAAFSASIELVAFALPLYGSKRAETSPLRRVAAWIPVLAGCFSIPTVIEAVTWLTTAFTGGH